MKKSDLALWCEALDDTVERFEERLGAYEKRLAEAEDNINNHLLACIELSVMREFTEKTNKRLAAVEAQKPAPEWADKAAAEVNKGGEQETKADFIATFGARIRGLGGNRAWSHLDHDTAHNLIDQMAEYLRGEFCAPEWADKAAAEVNKGEWKCPVCEAQLAYPPKDFNICWNCKTEFGLDDKDFNKGGRYLTAEQVMVLKDLRDRVKNFVDCESVLKEVEEVLDDLLTK